MKQAILMSIRPEWCVPIINGKKTRELRKKFPRCKLPIEVYIYCSKSEPILVMAKKDGKHIPMIYGWKNAFKDEYAINGKVIGKFTLNTIETLTLSQNEKGDIYITEHEWDEQDLQNKLCMNVLQFINYHLKSLKLHKGEKHITSYAYHIDNLTIFDEPKELSEFEKEEYAVMPNGTFPCYQPLTKAPQSWQYVWVKE